MRSTRLPGHQRERDNHRAASGTVCPEDRGAFTLRLSAGRGFGSGRGARYHGRCGCDICGDPVPGIEPGGDPLSVPAGTGERCQHIRSRQAGPLQDVGQPAPRQHVTVPGADSYLHAATALSHADEAFARWRGRLAEVPRTRSLNVWARPPAISAMRPASRSHRMLQMSWFSTERRRPF